MNEPIPFPADNGMEADIAVRKADREAASHADDLADRLVDIDIHQREARYLLERAGLLARRNRP
ncbi:MAG TPA: hypothetical protein VH834_17225 [Solirubrobacteraceae bacterium]|jgi:hypothetical protein